MDATKKVYVHYEGEPEFTHVAVIKLGLTAQQLAEEFTRAYNSKHGDVIPLDPTSVYLLNGRRRISNSENLIRFVKDRSDIFVEHESTRRAHRLEFYDETVSASNEDEDINIDSRPKEIEESSELAMDQELISLIEPELAAAAQRIQKFGQELEEPFILGALLYGLKSQQLHNYKVAAEIFLLVLEVLPIQKICLRGLGSMALADHDYSKARTWFEIGVAEFPMDDGFHARLGDTYRGLCMFEEALDEYDLATGLISEQSLAIPYREMFSEYPAMDVRLQTALDRLQCSLFLIDHPRAGDILGPATREGLKISSDAAYDEIRFGQSEDISNDDSINSPKQRDSIIGDSVQSSENPKVIQISESLLSYGDDLLLQSDSSANVPERSIDQISIPAFLPADNLKVRLQVFKTCV